MDMQHPVYTVDTECQDCYKCVRQCPVKAIRVQNGRAVVVPDLCITCGHCVEVCPAGAKHVRDDLGRARHLLERRARVYASLAPSWTAEFDGMAPQRIVAAIRQLGFAGVSETALGAQEVSARTARELAGRNRGLFCSSACPVAVEYLDKYMPDQAQAITRLLSPLLTHCRMLRGEFGPDLGIVFFGPCVAKKREADAHPELLDIALTFEDLRRWLEAADVHPSELEPPVDADFVPERAREGAIYPIEGGMLDTVRHNKQLARHPVHYATLAGVENMGTMLRGLNPAEFEMPVFAELLACEGGCVNGPCSRVRDGGLRGRLRVVQGTPSFGPGLERTPRLDIAETARQQPVQPAEPDEHAVVRALRRVGKTRPEHELNCGGCGYDSCRAFARALIEDKAEPAMCAGYMRDQAQKKANALLRCMPSGVVIVGDDMRIIECNEHFAGMFSEETKHAWDACPGLAGAHLERTVPFAGLFRTALKTGRDIHREVLRAEKRLFNVTVFTIEPHQVVGGVIQDVTGTELRREQIAKRARKVIHKNLATVQEIACRLGENMAETEVLLRSIADDYAEDAVGAAEATAAKREVEQ